MPLFLIFAMSAMSFHAQTPPCPAASTISIQKGWLDPEPGVCYQLTGFKATLLPKGKSAPSCYGRLTVVSRAQIFVSSESLTQVFSKKLQTRSSTIKDFRIEHNADGAKLTGSIKKLIPIHFSIEGPVTTDGTSVKLTAKKVKADGIPIRELLRLVGAELSSILPVKNMRGIQADEDSLSF